MMSEWDYPVCGIDRELRERERKREMVDYCDNKQELAGGARQQQDSTGYWRQRHRRHGEFGIHQFCR
jgi:PAB1-binding protein PBP1